MPHQITAAAPTRIDFAGGPTDVLPFSKELGGYVVNASINRKTVVKINKRLDKKIRISSSDLLIDRTYNSAKELLLDDELSLIKGAVLMSDIDIGIDIFVTTDAPVGSGLGASASVSVAVLYALQRLKKQLMDLDQIVEDAITLEVKLLNNIVGGQDQFAAAYGGFQSISYEKEIITRHRLNISNEFINLINNSTLLIYTGESRISGDVLAGIQTNYLAGNVSIKSKLNRLKYVAMQTEMALISNDINSLGETIDEAWSIQKCLHPTISTALIEDIINYAKSQGAIGGKVTGAGGGGCVLIIFPSFLKEKLSNTFSNAFVKILPFRFSLEGVKEV